MGYETNYVSQLQAEIERGYFSLNEESFHRVWMHSKIQTHEKRLDKIEQWISTDFESGKRKPVVLDNTDNTFFQHYEKLYACVDALRGREYIEDQFQHTTPILMEIDRIFKLYSESSDQFRKQLILKLRSALKLNCLEQLFTDEQVTLLLGIVDRLRAPVVEKQDVLDSLDELMDCDLSPFPSLEEDNRDNGREKEAFSGHNDSN